MFSIRQIFRIIFLNWDDVKRTFQSPALGLSRKSVILMLVQLSLHLGARWSLPPPCWDLCSFTQAEAMPSSLCSPYKPCICLRGALFSMILQLVRGYFQSHQDIIWSVRAGVISLSHAWQDARRWRNALCIHDARWIKGRVCERVGGPSP